jgi:hypothetical protein
MKKNVDVVDGFSKQASPADVARFWASSLGIASLESLQRERC